MNLRRYRALSIAHTGAFTALLAAGSWISIPFVPVPFTLQTLFLFLAAGIMGRYAVVPVSLYLLMGAMNLPVFHSGTAGIGVFLGPTGGYLAGFIPAALLAGIGYECRPRVARYAGMAAGLCALYACGVGWLSLSTGLSLEMALLLGAVPFIPGDIMKAAVASLVTDRIARLRAGKHADTEGEERRPA
ncbi:MAG: BioY family protein [Methanoregulaceae archaeon PtaU1.Bin059]|nr:MAG: BioY family protein [Methanoregulaceae archaeon PtaB.Bin152]OPY41792.1 MAG: BioY family protein [Methanoregulaceae archaeon PtaU1.Bin059]